MKERLKPIYLNNGEFFVDKNFKPDETAEIVGPVSFLFSCSNSALKKHLGIKLPLPGMFHVVQIYFSVIENSCEANEKICKLDYLQDVVEKYIEAFLWMKKSLNVNEIIVSEQMCNGSIFSGIVMQALEELFKHFKYEILFQNTQLILIKFFFNFNTEEVK